MIRRENAVKSVFGRLWGVVVAGLSVFLASLYGNRSSGSGFCLTPGRMCLRLSSMSHLTSSIIGIRIIGGICIRPCSRLA
jgi:hypothetical protein